MARDERSEDEGPDARGPGERARWRRDLILFAALFFLLIGAYAFDQARTRDKNREAILDAVSANCQTNHEQDERLDKLIDLFVGLAREQISKAPTPAARERSRAFLRDFAHGSHPVECGVQRQRVEDQLES